MIRQFRFRLDEQTHADILAMARDVAGKPGNLTAGLCAVFAEWRRLKAAEAIRLSYREARIARHEEGLDALDRRAEVGERGYEGAA